MTMEIYHSRAAEVPAVAMPEYFTGSGKLELMGRSTSRAPTA
ncbi:hypothetical protein [Nocardia albiluteola]|nr:hypothetical protein [Nocardia albiluteola]